MSVKIRLQRRGRKRRPFYHIVVADGRAPRDGRFIEKLGTYNPMTKPATIEIDRERAYEWLVNGAQPTDTARAILKFKGVLYYKHLQRGVTKGAISQEKADELFEVWITDKENKIRDRVQETEKEQEEFYAMLAGTPKPVKPKEEEIVEEAPAAEATAEEAAPAETETTEETATESEEAPAEETPAEETPTEEAKEEPAAESDEVEATAEAEKTEEPAAEEKTEAATESAEENSEEASDDTESDNEEE